MEYMTAIFSLELLGSSRSLCDVVDNCNSSVHSNSICSVHLTIMVLSTKVSIGQALNIFVKIP